MYTSYEMTLDENTDMDFIVFAAGRGVSFLAIGDIAKFCRARHKVRGEFDSVDRGTASAVVKKVVARNLGLLGALCQASPGYSIQVDGAGMKDKDGKKSFALRLRMYADGDLHDFHVANI
eukprot:GHVU01138483.1.p6 GENE.GHVU01138483.1~~GHVU01138483.1.p6  ORF type:complete len:120 (+),score=14.94 GHVU01138483.1:2450-2809(+)